MTKKIKLLLGGLTAATAIVVVPISVVACSSTVANVITKNESNLNIAGFPTGVTADVTATVVKMPATGLPNINGFAEVGELANYITFQFKGASLPSSTIVSNIKFIPGTTESVKTKAMISFSLGIYGSFKIEATTPGSITESTTFTSNFIKPSFDTIKDLSNYLNGVDQIGLENDSIIINKANTLNSYNPNGIQQYIYLYNSKNLPQGTLVGTWSIATSSWSWDFQLNATNQIVTNSNATISESGIPTSTNSLQDLSNSLDFLPALNQFNLTKNTTVNVAAAANNQQLISLTDATTTDSSSTLLNYILITGTYSTSTSSWAYSYKQTDNWLDAFTFNFIPNGTSKAPAITTEALDFSNASAITSSFTITSNGAEIAKSISGFKLKVTQSDESAGTATIEFSSTVGTSTSTISVNYSGFLKVATETQK